MEELEITKTFQILLSMSISDIILNVWWRAVHEWERYLDVISDVFNLSNSDVKKNNFLICWVPFTMDRVVDRDDFVYIGNKNGLLLRQWKTKYKFIYII